MFSSISWMLSSATPTKIKQLMGGVPTTTNEDGPSKTPMMKLVIVGSDFVGKSSLFLRFTDGSWSFEKGTKTTIGAEFEKRSINAGGLDRVLVVWDTPSHERFRDMVRTYFLGGDGFILVYDVTNRTTFDNLRDWYRELDAHAPPGAVRVLVGNKIDKDASRQVSTSEALSYASQMKSLFIETSVKTDTNVTEMFEWLVEKILDAPHSQHSQHKRASRQDTVTNPLAPTLPIADDIRIKFLLLGRCPEGKRYLLRRLSEGSGIPEDAHSADIDADSTTHFITLAGGTRVRVIIWDTAGQEAFSSVTPTYLRGAMAVVLVYDISDINSFNALPECYSKLGNDAGASLLRILVCTKPASGRGSFRRVVTTDAEALASQNNSLFFDVSEETESGVTGMFEEVVMKIITPDDQDRPLHRDSRNTTDKGGTEATVLTHGSLANHNSSEQAQTLTSDNSTHPGAHSQDDRSYAVQMIAPRMRLPIGRQQSVPLDIRNGLLVPKESISQQNQASSADDSAHRSMPLRDKNIQRLVHQPKHSTGPKQPVPLTIEDGGDQAARELIPPKSPGLDSNIMTGRLAEVANEVIVSGERNLETIVSGTKDESRTNEWSNDQVPGGHGQSQGKSEAPEGVEQTDEPGPRQEGEVHDPLCPGPLQDSMDGKNERETVIGWLTALFHDQDRYKNLLALKGRPAQTIVDLFQELLDSSAIQELALRKEIIVTLQKLANNAQLYPSSYRVEEEIIPDEKCFMGGGGFGEIFKCQYGGQPVCVKVIRLTAISQGPRFMKQFVKEAILWAQLSHPNIVPFRGFFYYSNKPCIVSPWMSNGHINDYLGNNPSSDRYLLVKDMTEGLHYLHTWGIVHGDLKGANVVVDVLGRAHLTDFGISSVFDAALPHWSSISTVASKGGSTRWQAPELLESNDDQDVHNTVMSDVYAWACTCYEIFTGKLPFYEIMKEFTIMLQVTRDRLRPSRPSHDDSAWLVWGLQEQFWNLMERCWAGDPIERPSVIDLLATPLLIELQDNRSSYPPPEAPTRQRMGGSHQMTVLTTNALERILSGDDLVS